MESEQSADAQPAIVKALNLPPLDDAARARIDAERKKRMNSPWAIAREEALRISETLRAEDWNIRVH